MVVKLNYGLFLSENILCYLYSRKGVIRFKSYL